MLTITSVALDDAQRIVAAGMAKANEIESPSVIAVADAGGRLVAFARMDGAWQGSIDIAIDKAFTARAFDIATKDLATLAKPGGQFYGIADSNEGHVMIFAGGVPLKTSDGQVVGAVGVSGGKGPQDQAVAEAAAAAF